jgi:membrane protease subunit (stomatin/prohibitin family)
VLGELQDLIATNAPGDLMKLNSMLGELEGAMVAKSREKFDEVGLMLKAFEMKPLTAAKTTAQDLRDMGLLDVATYQQLQAADAMREAAQQEGGAAGQGVGLGAGISMGQAMAGMMTQQAGGSSSDAISIAKERLAKGEITVAEFEEIKKALGG